jgi:hypothetical protein
VLRGRAAYICLTREQKRALRDPEGRIVLDVLRRLLGARPMTPERFPLTEQAFRAVASRLGYVLGQKRGRRMLRCSSTSGAVVRCGLYRQPYRNSAARSGFRVALYKLGPVWSLRVPRRAQLGQSGRDGVSDQASRSSTRASSASLVLSHSFDDTTSGRAITASLRTGPPG